MRLSPIDIQQQQFRKAFRGYDPHDVATFLELVAQQLAELAREHANTQNELRRTQRELEEHRDRETTLKEAMLTAQRAIDEIRQQAEKQAELILADADLRAEKILLNAHKRVSDVLEDIQDLKRQRARAIVELRGIVNTHDRLLKVHEKDQTSAEEEPEASITVLDRVRPPPVPRLEKQAGG